MIYLLRHQATYNNELGLISGQADSSILRETICKGNVDIIKNIEVVYSSPSQRCIDTLRLVPELKVLPIIDKRLQERNMGDFENGSRQNLSQEFPAFFRNIDGQICFRFELTPPNGESFLEFKERIDSFCLEEIIPRQECNILICSHNQAIKMMYFVLKGILPTKETWNRINFPNGEIIAYS